MSVPFFFLSPVKQRVITFSVFFLIGKFAKKSFWCDGCFPIKILGDMEFNTVTAGKQFITSFNHLNGVSRYKE